MGLKNINTKCHACPKSAAFAHFTVVNITLKKNNLFLYLLESNVCSFYPKIDVLAFNHENCTGNGNEKEVLQLSYFDFGIIFSLT